MKIQILHQSDDLVLVDKPAEALSVPSRFREDQRPVVGSILEKQLGVRVFPVHRLDFEVSGLMLFALTPVAHRQANLLFERQQVQKTYMAITEQAGRAPPQTPRATGPQLWQRKILRGKKRSYETPHGQLAVTLAEVVGKTPQDYLVWKLSPRTGKAHQLRLELSLQGFPIVGDALYGAKATWPKPGIALRAVSLQFPPDFAARFKIPMEPQLEPCLPDDLVFP
ncbi:MAG: RNA pseudouridine synthase [Bdellovibrio sp.]|nr:MAG: RNA pseudouridine synthase [Bdellovibrio sp.]